jgi:hypothetical protein
MKELIEYVKDEIVDAREYFDNDEHFDEVFEQAGLNDESARLFDCGYVKALEHILNKLQEYNGETE